MQLNNLSPLQEDWSKLEHSRQSFASPAQFNQELAPKHKILYMIVHISGTWHVLSGHVL